MSSTAQPNWVMIMLRTMYNELFMGAAIPQRLCAIKSEFGAHVLRRDADKASRHLRLRLIVDYVS
jgi:hypothetical protein